MSAISDDAGRASTPLGRHIPALLRTLAVFALQHDSDQIANTVPVGVDLYMITRHQMTQAEMILVHANF